MTHRGSKIIPQPLQPEPPSASIRPPENFEHIVQFYENDAGLAERTGAFISAGIKNGDAAIIISTSRHWEGLEAKLKESGLDVAGLEADRQLIHLDARETLGKFLVDGMPDEKLFRQVVGGLVQETLKRNPGLRAFGEMVALLWSEGNREAAARLEALWNDLSHTYAFSLFCAYPIKAFLGRVNEEAFAHVCDHHSRVLTSAGQSSIGLTAEERLRSLAFLQLKASSLESEILTRMDTEGALLEAKRALEQQLEDVHKLHELSGLLMVATELDPILREVLKATLMVYNTDKGALFLADPKRDGLRMAVQIGLAEEALGAWRFVAPGAGAAGSCYQSHRPVIVQDMEAEPSFEKYRGDSRSAGFRSVHCTPLINRDEKIIGVLAVYFKEPHAPNDREIRLVELHARHAADAIDAANLREQILLDAQNRKRAEEARMRLAAIVESSSDAIVSKDLSGIITSWNKGAERIFGYAENEVIGKSITILIPDELQDEEPGIIARIRKGDRIDHYETVRRHKDGRRIEVSLTVSPIMNEKGEIVGASKIARDITEHKRVRAALGESEMRFRDMADSAPVFVWMAAPDGLLTYFNKPWLDFAGRPIERELGDGWMEGIHPEDASRVKDGYYLALQAHTGFRMEYRMRRSDGIYRWMLVTGMPRISPAGEFLGFIGSGLDITELKDTEEQLRQAQKMEAVGRLAGGIAHDFNNLLTAINGYSEMALGMVEEDDPLHEYLGEIKTSGERAAALTQQLLAYSRKQILAPTVFDLNEAVSEMEKMLRRIIGEDIVLHSSLERGLGLAKADPGQIQQIILNLVLNARDAMPNGGRLILETANVTVGGEDTEYIMDPLAGPHVRLSVKDDGVGMTPEVKAKIFEPFFTTKALGHGTGLGLSSVYGIIKQSGGSIAVTSEPGRGSAFHVFLPVADAQSLSRAPRQAGIPHASEKGETILVVEDEETVRKFIQRTLASQGYDVLEASDGDMALKVIEANRWVDLVLTDVVMPNMNGGVLAERLKAVQPDINVLFMSGYTSNIFLSKGFLDPGARFLQKPFNQAELLQKVKQILQRSRKKPSASFSNLSNL